MGESRDIYIGTSGWQYNHWQGKFYPEGLSRSEWLSYYAHTFPTVEINSSFYHLPTETMLQRCYSSTPEGFIFSLKASRYITHVKRLRDVGEAITGFNDRVRLLKQRLGPVLYQLPPSLRRDDELLEGFLKLLPGDIANCIEFRHNSWLVEDVFGTLRRYKTGFCIFDMPQCTAPMVMTADFAYIRFHGSRELYSSPYSDEELREWARKILHLDVSRIFAYFNNDAGGYAIDNALSLQAFLLPPLREEVEARR